jgi:pseudouridine-5'-phosphate glycosidase
MIMTTKLPSTYRIQPEILRAVQEELPVVALESAVITHGLPYPQNEECALSTQEIIRQNGAQPATIALINGKIALGLTKEEINLLSRSENLMKISPRNLGIGIANGRSGGTTVAATLLAARIAGIGVFATGGIGGVHRGNPNDVSADLDELARSPVIVVCSGAKSILDLSATLEALESRGVPVLGFGTDEFPAFFSRTSGLKLDARVDSPTEIVAIAHAHWTSGSSSAILVCNPLSEEDALDGEWVDALTEHALEESRSLGISGSKVTPFLLNKLRELTEGKTLEANLLLLKNNARLAAEIASRLVKGDRVTF